MLSYYKRYRLILVLSSLLALGIAVGLILFAARDTVVFFFSPSELLSQSFPSEKRLRVGGLVVNGSVKKEEKTVRFVITDTVHSIPVVFTGFLPDLFREGQGVVAEGKLGTDGLFQASDVLAKHSETYMPPEVAETLKKTGKQPVDTTPPIATDILPYFPSSDEIPNRNHSQ